MEELENNSNSSNYIEEAVKNSLVSTKSELVRFFQHCLKYFYNREFQDRSWINSIRDSSRKISDAISNTNVLNYYKNQDNYKKAYLEGINKSKREGNDIPYDHFYLIFTYFETVIETTNPVVVEQFLKDNAYSSEVKKLLDL